MKAYNEIMNALRFYISDDDDEIPDESIYEIIGQEHNPIETIATALDEYRAGNKEK